MKELFPVLAATALAPRHPYALLDHLGSLGLAVSRSALYRQVERLRREGLAAAELESGETGHLRRRLQLTEAGRAALAAAAREVLGSAPLESPEFALALAAAETAGIADAEELLRARMAAAARQLTALERDLRTGSDPFAVARERQAAHLRADIGWLQQQLRRRAG
ncbi:helix-turn-helix transcriptional regulator [Tepidiforma sp.]|uniref:helix-turn-helix transcriptional regulator n=1 Tax=Tepidiforma sp. TaxID=2682230 RepID=UPI002ADE2E48|nr:helix-turn-helix transcriptional regulator [Tepidiforma sp.]